MALCGKIKIRFIFFKDGSISIEIHFLCTILMYVFDVFYFFSSFLQSSLARNVDCPYVVALSNQHWPVHYIPRLIKQVHVWGLKCILTAVKMSYCKEFDKDQVIFLTEEDAAQQSSIELPESGPGEASQGLISEPGEVNWFCPCLVRCLWINDVCSVTRFGEISPLWPEFKVFVKFLTDYFLFCKMLRLLWQICDIFG